MNVQPSSLLNRKIPIAWRMALWFLILAALPLFLALSSLRRQILQNAVQNELATAQSQARLYADRVLAEPDQKVEIGKRMSQATGDTFYLIAANGTYLAHPDPARLGRSAAADFDFETLQTLLNGTSATIYDEANGLAIGSYRQTLIDPLAVSVIKVQSAGLQIQSLQARLWAQAAAALLLTVAGMWAAAAWTTNPLSRLMRYAAELSRGNFNAQLETTAPRSELEDLGASLQIIGDRMKRSAEEMETELRARTREFERRSVLLKAVADVGKAITSFREISELLEQTTHLINEHFGYYHAGIFLLDDNKEYAVLVAANSEGGKKMLARNHRLKVGETGIVGYVTQNAKARIALDVGADAVYFDNPDLPKTRSEMALPLVVGGQILGALDVQSVEPQAFTEEDISTLQILAEQLAVAIQNANLLNEMEKALEASRAVYGELSREAWSKLLREQPRIGFLATPPGTVQTRSETLEPNLAKAFETGGVVIGGDHLTISVPIKIRGQAIGAIRLKKAEIAEAWSQEEINLAASLADQLSGALESARLYRESQQRAARETLLSEISARISAASHTDAILRETVQELGQTFAGASVTFQLLENFATSKQANLEEIELISAPRGQAGGAA